MKRLILAVLVGIAILGLTCSQVLAQERSIPLSATASSVYYDFSSYTADKAVDGELSTFWAGGVLTSSWWIQFEAEDAEEIESITIEWLGHPAAIPGDFDIQASIDGSDWQDVLTGLAGTFDKDSFELNVQARYLKLLIHQTEFMPVIREFRALRPSIPHLIRFQGFLGDEQGIPLNDSYELTFRIYDVEAAGVALWEEIRVGDNAVNIEEGFLDVKLGEVTELNLPFNKPYWLGIEVGADGEMVPRFELTTVPYAFTSEE